MTGPAAAQFGRIIQLVAELSRREQGGEPEATLPGLAASFGVSVEQIRRDVQTLTAASDEASVDWLSSISIEQEGDRLRIASRGPYRRPVRLTPLELFAIQVGLALESDGTTSLAKRIAAALGDEPAAAAAGGIATLPPTEREAAVLGLAREAARRCRPLQVKYAGSKDRVGADRVIEPHEIVTAAGRYYISGWCRQAEGWRRFRADRVLDALIVTGETFVPRELPAAEAGTPFHSEDEQEAVEVRFSQRIARFIVEEYPETRTLGDGAAVVTLHVADPHWLVRRVLQYGDEAEVVAPVHYREVMRKAVTRGS